LSARVEKDNLPKPDFKTRNLKYLLGTADKVADGGPTNEYGAHTLVKLIALASYSYQFCNIVNGEKTRARGYDGSVYVDLFAGPGLVKITGKPDVVAGSPIAADSGGRFDLAVLVEKQKRKAEALRRRMGALLPTEKFEVIEGDCNEKIEEVAALISKRFSKPIILAFIDPEGLDISIKTLDVLSKRFPSVDFIVNVTEGMGRVQSTIKDGETKNRPKFERFVGDALSGLFLNEAAFDLVVANPPYVPTAQIESLAPEVRDYEPRLALDGGPDGLDAYRRLAPEILRVLRPGARFAVEIGTGQREAVEILFRNAGAQELFVCRDLAGRERVVAGRKKPLGN
jgi:three-Cys-motif partner protein